MYLVKYNQMNSIKRIKQEGVSARSSKEFKCTRIACFIANQILLHTFPITLKLILLEINYMLHNQGMAEFIQEQTKTQHWSHSFTFMSSANNYCLVYNCHQAQHNVSGNSTTILLLKSVPEEQPERFRDLVFFKEMEHKGYV